MEDSNSIEDIQKRIEETSDALDRVQSERAELISLLETLDSFVQEHGGKLEHSRFDAYNAFLPQGLSKYKADVAPHLANIDAYIAELGSERDLHVQHLARQRRSYSSGSLVYRIPFEILGNIFTIAVKESDYASFIPLTLAAVCTSWREAAHRTPTVWSKISVRVLPEDCQRVLRHTGITSIAHARKWIERSGVTRLQLRVEWNWGQSVRYSFLAKESRTPPRNDWVELISSVGPRLQHFELRCVERSNWIPTEQLGVMIQHDMPHLTLLCLDGDITNLDRSYTAVFPALQRLPNLVGVEIGSNHGSPFAPSCKIAELGPVKILALRATSATPLSKLMGPWLSDVTRHSLRFLSLERDRYMGISAQEDDSESLSSLSELPGLEELHIADLQLCADFFRVFEVPSLKVLGISTHRPRQYDRYARGTRPILNGKTILDDLFDKMRFPELREFTLEHVKGVDERLRKFLRAHMDLSSLRLYEVACEKTLAALVSHPKQSRYITCPRLRQLDVYPLASSVADPVTVEQLVQARYTDAVPEESFSESAKQFARLSSLRWEGEERLGQVAVRRNFLFEYK